MYWRNNKLINRNENNMACKYKINIVMKIMNNNDILMNNNNVMIIK